MVQVKYDFTILYNAILIGQKWHGIPTKRELTISHALHHGTEIVTKRNNAYI